MPTKYSPEYYQAHKSQYKASSQKYKRSHKEQIRLKQLELIYCPCGSHFKRCYKSRHQKTHRHKKFVETGISELEYDFTKKQHACVLCGGSYTLSSLPEHLNTDQHKSQVKSISN